MILNDCKWCGCQTTNYYSRCNTCSKKVGLVKMKILLYNLHNFYRAGFRSIDYYYYSQVYYGGRYVNVKEFLINLTYKELFLLTHKHIGLPRMYKYKLAHSLFKFKLYHVT
jgi:hypothetical protein